MIYSVIDGLYLYNSILDSDTCVGNIEEMAIDLSLAAVAFNLDERMGIVLNSTDSLGWLGPIARTCYQAGGNSQDTINIYKVH